jgi:hypothetical protein
MQCAMCHDRHLLLPRLTESDSISSTSSSVHSKSEFEHPVRSRVLAALHTVPDPEWLQILATQKLCAGELQPRPGSGTMWFRFPLRGMQPLRCAEKSYVVEGRHYEPHEIVWPVFHNTRLASLVGASETAPTTSRGIFGDGFLQYGTCSHQGAAGVNYYTDGGVETFSSGDKWVSLELAVTAGVQLKNGRAHGYCIKGRPGRCFYAQCKALWVMATDVPTFALLS